MTPDAAQASLSRERRVEIRSIRTPGLGDATYVLAHEGQAIVVDPQRDVERFLQVARELGGEVRFVLETHLHNDYVSGGRTLAGEAGASLVLPAGAGAAFEYLPAFHQEEIHADAGLTIRPLHTPGHTPEHVSYLILLNGQPAALFSGGSLLVGSAGRSDLLGMQRARQLARLQFGSLQRLARLPDEVGLFPTHGEGSFCTVSGAGRTTSTIGQEKRENSSLAYPDADAFAEGQLSGLQPYPSYYAHMAPINLRGPQPLPATDVPDLTPADVADRSPAVHLVDARRRAAFAAGHVPGALSVELSDQFGTWVGWLLPFNADVMLVLDPDQDAQEAVVQLARIGFDRVRGVLRGLDRWRAEGRPVASLGTTDVESLAAEVRASGAGQMLDVRAPAEWEADHVPDSRHRYLPDLVEGPPPGLALDRPVWVACASGFRATIGASLLAQHGARPVVLLKGGVDDVLERLRQPAASAPAPAPTSGASSQPTR